ncbi:guanylate-binding protein 1-like isoform X3 [Numida meleagris]|uniref:guanylate-binding protein 1-like isoform X3 n=1 Tax=Numida meleagris TaxID=8996 RepID=UPI000B3DC347|nr:guanylate-binding protein 1-like isoform X3 [Numida meleagris]XP_021238681.1 guanylate-binding protein 1-like isoform X3 [Numida meleagris]XP_021238682.1 guanylate-binding protein 1-like isoform X3 [Numida meleagris]XP_021238683.1 guanylate-binding protein 1-like isoform X3 [Numida meleagris]XP_021238684.1 guanylate-binding protein 1-like isoform X3 [Numida meleagris]XP_021238685.1 guanylate-binding protein 1-like isoform X3 [Numida meleagris]XP_021238686.1 guanylate-binding protein 1-like
MASAASVPELAEPICLVENEAGQGLAVRQDALQVLANVTQPVVVVAITGLYRSGKSYLLNRLAGRRTGFSLGSNVQGHTKGIWMWCLPHPCQPGHTLVLLDTEGLGRVEKGDTKNDAWIFVLAVLLSSTLIYNSRGTIDQQALENLHYVLTLAEHIRLSKSPGESGAQLPAAAELAQFLPSFVWAVRDFTLQLEADGKELSEDEYLEQALKLRGGSSAEAESYDRLRECIRQFFPERRCFVFDLPASKRDLPHLEELPDDRMDPEFRQQLEKFCSYIWERSPPKTTPSGCKVTGHMLGTLAVSYVDAIQSGAVPCLESAVLALAELHNSAVVREAAALYRELMEQRATLPMETAQELHELHELCEQETLQLFTERAITDDIERFRVELLRQVEAARLEFCSRDERASHEKCKAALQELSREMEQRINNGGYLVPGGHRLFLGDQQALVERYRALPGKGVKADAVLQEFLQRTEPLARIIRYTDRALTEKDEQIKGLQAQNEKDKQEWQAESEREAEKLQQMEERAHRSEEEARQLRESLEKQGKKKSHSEGAHFGDVSQQQGTGIDWEAGIVVAVLAALCLFRTAIFVLVVLLAALFVHLVREWPNIFSCILGKLRNILWLQCKEYFIRKLTGFP